jgi:glycosyltransferase involved in cell wall biosynthesis
MPSAFLYSYTRSKDFYLAQRVPKEKLFFHPCAVNNEYFQTQAKKGKKEKNKIRDKLNIPKKSKVILYVGRIDSRKRTLDIVEAYNKLEDKKEIYLVYVGNGPEEKEISKFAKKNNLKNVKLYGAINRNELYKFYSIADMFVIPSDYDPSPKVMNEAMNFSLPIITSYNVGTSQDLIKEGINGFILEVGDVKVLSEKMEKILKDNSLRKSMGKESLKIVSKWNFDEDVKATIKALNYIHNKK